MKKDNMFQTKGNLCINHDVKKCSMMHGHCDQWKTAFAKAKELGYRFATGYGLEGNTQNKRYWIDPYLTERILQGTPAAPSDIRDWEMINKIAKYLDGQGYSQTRDYTEINRPEENHKY